MSKEKAMELVLDGMEVAFKQSVESSLLKDIPIVGSIVKMYEVGASVKDHLFAAKIQRFLSCLDDVSDEDKIGLRKAIAADTSEVQKLSQKIVLVLETQSDIEKSEIIANLFLAYVNKQINSSEFRRALDVTSNFFLDDIKKFATDSNTGFILATYDDLVLRGYENLVGSPLIGIDNSSPQERRGSGWDARADMVLYASTSFASTYRFAYQYGSRLRRAAE